MTPEQVRAKKTNIFATYDSIDEVIKYASVASAPAIITVGIAINTTLELIAKEMENEKNNVD